MRHRSFEQRSEAVVGSLVESGRPPIHDKLRQRQHFIDVVLNLYIMVLESIIHLVQNSHYLRDAEVNPIQLRRTLQFMPQECNYLIELHSKALIHVLFPCSFPGNFLFVLPVAEFKVVLDELPVHRSSCCCFYFILWCLSEQLSSIILMQDVDDHCLSAAYDLFSILQIGKVDCRILLLELRIILLLPFILR